MGFSIFGCDIEEDLVPCLYPGAGRTENFENRFPVIMSPFPNSGNCIVADYSDLDPESDPADELPPEIAALFE